MVVNRVCYFKKLGANGLALAADVSDALGQKANSADVYLASAVDTLLSVKLVASDISGKANSADVTSALANKLEAADVAGFAVAADVTSALANKLEAADISGKANSSDVTSALANKLEAADVAGFAVASDVTSALANKLESADIAGKLDASVFTTRKGAENALFSALKDALYIESGPSSGVEFDYTDLDL